MKAYLIRRLLLIIPTLIGISLVTFFMIQLAPGDPAELRARSGENLSGANKDAINSEIIEATRKIYQLDKSLPIQYLLWLKRLITLDFGYSIQDHRSVSAKIRERLPITIILSIFSILIAYLIAIPLGIYSATHSRDWGDRIITFILFMLYSLPTFWIATLAIVFLCGGDFFSWFPPAGIESLYYFEKPSWWGRLTDRAWHLVLPIICLTYGSFAFLSRQMRSGMLEVIRQDYIRTARAKGLQERVVICKHALRNSLIPILTLVADILPAMIGGSVIIESLFSIPGMGNLSFEAILYRDYPVIMAVFTVSAFLTLAGILVSDLLYAVVDPRISFDALN